MAGCLLCLFVGPVFLYHEVVDDEVLAVHGVLAHVVFQQLRHLIALVECHLVQSDVGSDEVDELLGADFSQSLEACDFGVRPKVVDSLQAFLVGVAVLYDVVFGDCLLYTSPSPRD